MQMNMAQVSFDLETGMQHVRLQDTARLASRRAAALEKQNAMSAEQRKEAAKRLLVW